MYAGESVMIYIVQIKRGRRERGEGGRRREGGRERERERERERGESF